MQENYIGLKYLPAFFISTSVNPTKKGYINAGVTVKINYSTSSSCLNSTSSVNPQPLPVPIKIFHVLDDDDNVVLSYREILNNKAGVYSFINTVNGKLYI